VFATRRSSTACATTAMVWTLILAGPVVTTAFAQVNDDDNAVLKLAEPDFTLVSLPTALRLPRFGSALRFTHRFALPLEGDFGTLAGNLFGLDSGSTVGLEWRFGVVKNGQLGLHRSSSNKTIEFFGEYGLVQQGDRSVLEALVRGGVEGTNNFRDNYTGSLMLVVSRRIGEHAALYVEPTWVKNSNLIPPTTGAGDNVLMIGLGGRVRIRRTVYLVGEYSPVAAGDNGRTDHGAVAIEKRAGGHVFQFNVSNSFATTPGQLAHGSAITNDWHIGFNITRKLF